MKLGWFEMMQLSRSKKTYEIRALGHTKHQFRAVFFLFFFYNMVINSVAYG